MSKINLEKCVKKLEAEVQVRRQLCFRMAKVIKNVSRVVTILVGVLNFDAFVKKLSYFLQILL